MKYFNCLDCKNSGDSCEDCEKFLYLYNFINKKYKKYENTECKTNWDLNFDIPDSCRGCPNHPSNGGNGICHCILGQYNIT